MVGRGGRDDEPRAGTADAPDGDGAGDLEDRAGLDGAFFGPGHGLPDRGVPDRHRPVDGAGDRHRVPGRPSTRTRASIRARGATTGWRRSTQPAGAHGRAWRTRRPMRRLRARRRVSGRCRAVSGGRTQLLADVDAPVVGRRGSDHGLPDRGVGQPDQLDDARGQHGHGGRELHARRPRAGDDAVLPGRGDQRGGHGSVLERGDRPDQRRCARCAGQPPCARGRPEEHHDYLGGSAGGQRGADHRLPDPRAACGGDHLDHDPRQHELDGDDVHAHEARAGDGLALPGGGDQLGGRGPGVAGGGHRPPTRMCPRHRPA